MIMGGPCVMMMNEAKFVLCRGSSGLSVDYF